MSKLIYDKMSMGVMRKACAAVNVKASTTIVATAAVLTRYYKQNTTPAEDLSKCSTCNGKSDFKLEACPFCGDDGKVTAGGTAEKPAEPTPEVHAAEVIAPEPESTPVPNDAPTGAGKPVSVAEPKKPKTITVRSEEIGEALAAERSDAEKRLDESVAKIASLRRQSAEDLWALGHEIRLVYSEQLWTARKKPGSAKPIYTQFAKFCEVELGVSRPLAYGLMDVAATFTIEQIRQYGATKLGLIVKLPEQERARLLEQFGGKSVREISREAKAAKAAKKGNRSAAPKSGTAPAADESRTVSAIVRMGERVVVPLLRGGVKRERHPVAKTLADHPWGIEKHANAVETHYSIQTNDQTGALELVIERRHP